MSGLIRIRFDSSNVRHLVERWQYRHEASGAVHPSAPSTLLLPADTSVEAIEDLVRSLEGADLEIDIIWREGALRA